MSQFTHAWCRSTPGCCARHPRLPVCTANVTGHPPLPSLSLPSLSLPSLALPPSPSPSTHSLPQASDSLPLPPTDSLPPSESLPALAPLIDLFPFNDEVDMLLYRLRLHSALVDTFVIVESTVTYSGGAKPLHAHEALRSLADRAAWSAPVDVPATSSTGREGVRAAETIVALRDPAARVRLLNVSLPHLPESTPRAAFARETMLRKFITQYVAERVSAEAIVSISDVDELLDRDALGAILSVRGCARPRLRHFWYGERCVKLQEGRASRGWGASLLFPVNTSWFRRQVAAKAVLRYYDEAACPLSPSLWGWCS